MKSINTGPTIIEIPAEIASRADLTLVERIALAFVHERAGFSNAGLARRLGLSIRGVESMLARLRKHGLILQKGRGRGRWHELTFKVDTHNECGQEIPENAPIKSGFPVLKLGAVQARKITSNADQANKTVPTKSEFPVLKLGAVQVRKITPNTDQANKTAPTKPEFPVVKLGAVQARKIPLNELPSTANAKPDMTFAEFANFHLGMYEVLIKRGAYDSAGNQLEILRDRQIEMQTLFPAEAARLVETLNIEEKRIRAFRWCSENAQRLSAADSSLLANNIRHADSAKLDEILNCIAKWTSGEAVRKKDAGR